MLPCGQCIGCRLERSRQWAIRCMHEADMHEDNCFITLTYNEENLPKNRSLQLEDFQNFMKRLRKAYDHKIRFFHCGEYGEKLGRPHYHALLFGHDFKDRERFKNCNGYRLDTSDELSGLWKKGFHLVGDVTFESAAYVARYIMKKVTGEKMEDHYKGLKPEYVTMSRRDGIGKGWYEKFKKDVYPDDFVVVNGGLSKAPRYYDGLLDKDDHKMYEMLKERRKEKGLRMVPTLIKDPITNKNKIILTNDNDSFRLRVKENVKRAQIKNLKRHLEEVL